MVMNSIWRTSLPSVVITTLRFCPGPLPQVVIEGCSSRFTCPHYKEIRQRRLLHAINDGLILLYEVIFLLRFHLLSVQDEPQLIPVGLLVTVPLPEPAVSIDGLAVSQPSALLNTRRLIITNPAFHNSVIL